MLITKNVKSDTKNMNNEMYIASDFVTFEQHQLGIDTEYEMFILGNRCSYYRVFGHEGHTESGSNLINF